MSAGAIEYLDVADFLVIAEAVLSIEADVLAKATNLALADSALNAPCGGIRWGRVLS